jgi:uncharacterized protein
MKRDAEKDLHEWKNERGRSPLIIRGARQVGKSYLVEEFGRKAFDNLVVVNFEFEPRLKSCFETFNPVEIVNKLRLHIKDDIVPEKTLLFLDELQECPKAIISLRYFKERMPSLHILGAGSLLEFALRREDLRMPVGRVEFLHLQPLSFGEFLEAIGHGALRVKLSDPSPNAPLDESLHEKLLGLVRQYLVLGGMPAVVNEFLSAQDVSRCRRIQSGLLQTYRMDFGKYARTVQHKYLEKVFDAIPHMAGQRIKYSRIDPESKSRDLKSALEALIMAGVAVPVHAVHASGLPLGWQKDEGKLKINFVDVGLAQNACGLQTRIMEDADLLRVNAGGVAESFVGQELSAAGERREGQELYFWARDKKNSSAEVDYVRDIGSRIVPIEVKAGKTGTLKSLRIFMEEKKTDVGVRISQEPLSFFDGVLSVPLYMIDQLPRLIAAL